MVVTQLASTKSSHRFLAPLALAIAVASAPMVACAASPDSIWTPQIYNLGGPSWIPVVISTRVDTGDGEEDVTVTGRRAPQSRLGTPDMSTPQSIFDIGGDPMRRPSNCDQDYTTIAGQPAAAPDLAERVGIRGCYF
jgi:hypothetical protein